jgi:hypothetical protein
MYLAKTGLKFLLSTATRSINETVLMQLRMGRASLLAPFKQTGGMLLFKILEIIVLQSRSA